MELQHCIACSGVMVAPQSYANVASPTTSNARKIVRTNCMFVYATRAGHSSQAQGHSQTLTISTTRRIGVDNRHLTRNRQRRSSYWRVADKPEVIPARGGSSPSRGVVAKIFSGAVEQNLPSTRHQNSVLLDPFSSIQNTEKLDKERVLGV